VAEVQSTNKGEIAQKPVLGGAMLGAAPVTVLGSLYIRDYNLQFLEQADYYIV